MDLLGGGNGGRFMEEPLPNCDSKLVHLDLKNQPQNLVTVAMGVWGMGVSHQLPHGKSSPSLVRQWWFVPDLGVSRGL